MAAFIERLHDLPSDGVADLLSESEQAGLRFVRRLVEEWASGANRFDRPGEALFGAWVGGRLIGVCGLNVDPYARDERVGRVRRLYVLSPFRRLGVGRQLVAHVIEAARGWFDTLHVRTENPAAARLYEAAGFRPCVGVGDYTHVVEVGLRRPTAQCGGPGARVARLPAADRGRSAERGETSRWLSMTALPNASGNGFESRPGFLRRRCSVASRSS